VRSMRKARMLLELELERVDGAELEAERAARRGGVDVAAELGLDGLELERARVRRASRGAFPKGRV
jgi:hypothetical protein